MIGNSQRTLKKFVPGYALQTLIQSSLSADEVLQEILVFLQNNEHEYNLSEKTYKVVVNETIETVEDERKLKYQINLTLKEGDA